MNERLLPAGRKHNPPIWLFRCLLGEGQYHLEPNIHVTLSSRSYREVSLGNGSAVEFISAGAVLPRASQATNANACSFATARRHAIVGGALVATVADLPNPSVYVRPP